MSKQKRMKMKKPNASTRASWKRNTITFLKDIIKSNGMSRVIITIITTIDTTNIQITNINTIMNITTDKNLNQTIRFLRRLEFSKKINLWKFQATIS